MPCVQEALGMLFSDLRHTRSKVGMLRKRPCWCCTSCPACARRLFMMSCHCVGSIDFNGILGKEKGDSNPDLHEVCHTRLASRYGRLARNLFRNRQCRQDHRTLVADESRAETAGGCQNEHRLQRLPRIFGPPPVWMAEAPRLRI